MTGSRLQALRSARAQFEDKLAPDFSVFDFIIPDELKLSRIVGWLLDPGGTHGQGSAFLRSFLDWLGDEWAGVGAAGVTVRLEAPVPGGRRIDILICGPNWAVAIENKPWACDQDGQLSDYLAHLRIYPKRCLLYLTGESDRLPGEHSLGTVERDQLLDCGELRMSAYVQLCEWIELCRGACRAERVRAFMDDFQDYILQEFGGSNDMTEQRALIETMVANPVSVEAAASIAAAWPAAQAQLLSKLSEQLQVLLPVGWKLEGELDRYKDSELILGPAGADHSFALAFESSWYGDFAFGIRLTKPSDTRARQLCALVRATDFGQGSGTPNSQWAWWRNTDENDPDLTVSRHWKLTSQPWKQIQNNELALQIVVTARRLLGATGAEPADSLRALV